MMRPLRLQVVTSLQAHRVPYVYTRDDIQQRSSYDPIGIIECKSVCDTSAAVMSVRNKLGVGAKECVDDRCDVFPPFTF